MFLMDLGLSQHHAFPTFDLLSDFLRFGPLFKVKQAWPKKWGLSFLGPHMLAHQWDALSKFGRFI